MLNDVLISKQVTSLCNVFTDSINWEKNAERFRTFFFVSFGPHCISYWFQGKISHESNQQQKQNKPEL